MIEKHTARATNRVTGLLLSFVVASTLACPANPPVSGGLDLAAEAPADRVVAGVYDAVDPEADVVTLDNLFESERFWPYQVALTEDWKPVGWEGRFGWGLGVVLRIDEQNRIRVDFSRFGKHWIPARVTDVVERANAIRLGADQKFAPNLVLALGNRLLDPSGRALVQTKVEPLEQRAFLLVFADPRADEFPAIAASVARIEAVDGVHVVLIAQGGHADSHIYKACHDAGWRGSFLLDRFGPAYTRGYLEADEAPPQLQLMSPEGRLIWSAAWSAAAVDALADRFAEG